VGGPVRGRAGARGRRRRPSLGGKCLKSHERPLHASAARHQMCFRHPGLGP
jgi:hypothetical protein